MTNFNHAPIYNLKAVINETGLKAELIRAWERRYKLPVPQRTPGGHRLYSDYDIATLKWLHARQMEGLSISRAVELWGEIIESGRDPLMENQSLALHEEARLPIDDNQMEILRRDWLKACLDFKPAIAEELIDQAFSMYPVETVCFDLILKSLNEIGSLWHQGKITVQQEHFTSNLAVRRVFTLTAMTPNPTRGQTILLGCPARELHTFPMLVLNLLLRRKGFNVIYLGADIPIEQWEQTAAAVQPELVILSAQRLESAVTLRHTALLLKKMHVRLAYGGLIFTRIPSLREKIPAHFLGENLKTAPDRIVQILAAHPDSISFNNSETASRSVELFHQKISAIKAAAMETLPQAGSDVEDIKRINEFFSSGLASAMELGNPTLMEPDLDWVKQLLTERKISVENMYRYLNAYKHAVQQEMGEDGSAITQWISSYLAKSERS